MMTRAILLTATGLVFLTGAPAAAVVYVDQNACSMGDDGTSWEDAFHSIQMAIDFAAGGDDKEIWVADGVYAEPLTLYDGIALYGGFTGCSDGDETDRAQRDPAAFKAVIDADGADHAVVIEKVKDVTLDGFVVRNASHGIVFCQNASDVTIARCTIGKKTGWGWEPGILPFAVHCTQSTVRVLANRIADNDGGGGILFDHTEGEIEGNTIAHNRGEAFLGGINCRESSPVIENNLIVDNRSLAWGGVWADAHSKPKLINNTIVANKTEGPMNTGGVLLANDEALVVNCILWGNGVDLKGGTAKRCIIENGGPDADNLRADPQFVNPAKGDYRLKPGSPAIDAGDAAAVEKYKFDLAGNPRVCDGDGKGGPQVDIGAYEYCPKAE